MHLHVGPGNSLIKCHFLSVFSPKSQKTTFEILKYFDNELKFGPKRDFNTAHVQLVGCHWPKVQLPRACLGKAVLIMGGRGYEGNHLCKLLTSSDETRKKPMNLNTEISWCFEHWISLRSRSKFLHDRSGGLSLSNDQFDLTKSNVSNAIYTPGPCLKTN